MLPFQQPEIISYSQHLAVSFKRWTGRELLPSPLEGEGAEAQPKRVRGAYEKSPHPAHDVSHPLPQGERELLALALYHAPFILVSHGTQADPIFRYANLAAQQLWEMDWEKFTALPSRMSAEPDVREERQRLLELAEKQGYVDNYKGVRVTASGKRFRIENCILWNVLNETGDKIGQAATFDQWEWLENRH